MTCAPWLPGWLTVAATHGLERRGREEEAHAMNWVALGLFLCGMAATP